MPVDVVNSTTRAAVLDRIRKGETHMSISQDVGHRLDFWSDFDYQHATFNGDRGALSRQSKTFLPGKSNSVHLGGNDLVMNEKNSSGRWGGGAKLLYNLSLFANRTAITESVKWDIALKLGKTIRQIAPPAGQGGVLVSYAVNYSKMPDAMGQTVGSYAHDFALLGTGARSTEPYQRAMSGSMTISNPATPRARVAPSQKRVICYLWVFRTD